MQVQTIGSLRRPLLPPFSSPALPLHNRLLQLVILVVAGIEMASARSGKCSLVTIYSLKTADCINLGLTSLPRHLDGDLKALNFHDNRLSVLGPDSFRTYPSLQNLYLVRNVLENISDDAFLGLQNLQILDLEGNKLNVTPGNAFRHVTSLRILILKSNPILIIRNDHLRFLKNVETLNFENCWLHTIESRAFLGLTRLYELNLVNNELKTLDAEMEETLAKTVTTVRLHSNPWICDCRLRWLRKYLNRIPNWEFASNIPTCAGPDLLRAVFMRFLSPEQFACPSAIVGNSSTSIELKAGGNVSIECIVFGDPDPTITWMKGPKFVPRESISEGYFMSGSNAKEKHHRSVVTLRNVTQLDASDYKCIASNPAGRSEVTYKVWIVQSETGPATGVAKTFGLGFEVMLGAAIAGVALLVVFVLCVCCVASRHRTRRRQTRKLQDENFKKEFAFTAQRSEEKESVEPEVHRDGRPGTTDTKESFLMMTSVVDTNTDAKKSPPMARQTTLSEDKNWAEEDDQNPDDEGVDRDRKSEQQLPEIDKESGGFRMKIFASSPTDGCVEVCDDRSSTASLKSQSGNNAAAAAVVASDGVDESTGGRRGVDRCSDNQGSSRIKESPPDLLCDRHVMISSSKDKRLERLEQKQQQQQQQQQQQDNRVKGIPTEQRTAQPLRPTVASSVDSVPTSKRSNQENHSERSVTIEGIGKGETVKSPVKPHCDNPICMKDRAASTYEKTSTSSNPPAQSLTKDLHQLCSHKSASQPPLHPAPATRADSSSSSSWRTEFSRPLGEGHAGPQHSTLQRHSQRNHQQSRRNDAYATLPSKPQAVHGRRVEFSDVVVNTTLSPSSTTSTKDHPQPPSMRIKHTPRVAMTTRNSFASDYVTLSSSPPTNKRSTNRGYVTDYLGFPMRSAALSPSPAEWFAGSGQTKSSRDYPRYSSSKLSGSSSTLDVRGEDQTTPLMARKGQGCSATSLLDLLSPPFGQTQQQQQQQQRQPNKKPKPGEQDEFGTAV